MQVSDQPSLTPACRALGCIVAIWSGCTSRYPKKPLMAWVGVVPQRFLVFFWYLEYSGYCLEVFCPFHIFIMLERTGFCGFCWFLSAPLAVHRFLASSVPNLGCYEAKRKQKGLTTMSGGPRVYS